MDAKIEALIQKHLAKPKTHKVVTRYDSGEVHEFECPSLKQAENHAIGPRRKIGKPLIDRKTDKVVRIVSVTVERI